MRKALTISGTIALAGLSAIALSGCSYDYLQHTDRVSYSSGDAVNANLEGQTVNPSNSAMYATSGLGKDGSVLVKSTGSGQSSSSGATSTTSP